MITPCITICRACRGSHSAKKSMRAAATPIARRTAASSCAATANGHAGMRSLGRPIRFIRSRHRAGPREERDGLRPRILLAPPRGLTFHPVRFDIVLHCSALRSRCTVSPPCQCTTSRPPLAADWRTLLERVRANLADWLNARGDTFAIVDPGPDLTAFWLRDDVLLSQTCGYPLVHALADRVRLVAAPDFDVPGCADGTYRSVLVAGARVAAPSIEACRGLRAAYKADDDSNSGMNLLRHAVAPFARDGRFFASVTQTGSHLASLRALAENRAEIAAIDCVTLAFVQSHLPKLAGVVRVLEEAIDTLLRTLTDALLDQDAALARQLRLKGFLKRTPADYAPILACERDAIALGYPRLA
ncbi:MAG: ABC-type phosphate/phosphonate transport system, periplasmic component [uncultured Caballeronia sp.]|nr:MAG: ABC-type phosphate/phosphonate transport system, periplasmic component [uncultured Caballeronia sp.]